MILKKKKLPRLNSICNQHCHHIFHIGPPPGLSWTIGRLLTAKFNLVPVPELAIAPFMYKFDCFAFCRSRSAHSKRGEKIREKAAGDGNTFYLREKNVYNIIKVIPNSFYCLHYARNRSSGGGGASPAAARPTMSYLLVSSAMLYAVY